MTRDPTTILDIGPKSAARRRRIIANAGTIVWNGPVGVFEYAPVRRHQDDGLGHRPLRGLLHRRRRRHPGGHRQVRHRSDVGYISTGGGGSPKFLEGKMPAIAALEGTLQTGRRRASPLGRPSGRLAIGFAPPPTGGR